MKKTRIKIAALAALAAVSMIGGTWAVWTQRLLAKNEYETAKYSTLLEEEFKGPEQWQPGITEKKEVKVKNDSTIPIIAKITMNQNWIRREDVKAATWNEEKGELEETVVSPKGEVLPVTFDGPDGEEFAAVLNLNKDAVVVLASNRHPEASMRLDISEVRTIEQARGKWLLTSEVPDEKGNFTFYYMASLAPGAETPLLLSTVTMNPLLETTITGSETYYEKDPEAEGGYRKITVDMKNSKYGYDSSTFTLNINMQTVQATKDAVDAILPKDPFSEYIAGYIAGSGVFESTSVKRLWFREQDGVMTYTPYRTTAGGVEEGNWFMSFTNMVPGGIYKDKLQIENASRKPFRVFMRIIPRTNQTQIQDELLKKIAMKIYYRDKLIYDGDVTGYHYSDLNGRDDMQGLVPLGIYYRNRKEEIRVELVLDPDLGLNDDGTYKYADVLTKIDWEFMVQEVVIPSGGGSTTTTRRQVPPTTTIPDEGVPLDGLVTIGDGEVPLTLIPDEDVPLAFMVPTTGDDFPLIPLVVTALVSMMLMVVFYRLGFGKKKKVE